jgi:hypothetical protein
MLPYKARVRCDACKRAWVRYAKKWAWFRYAYQRDWFRLTKAKKFYLLWAFINLSCWVLRSMLACEFTGWQFEACTAHLNATSADAIRQALERFV